MLTLQSLVTPARVEEFVKGRIENNKLNSDLVKVIPHEVIHNGNIRSYLTCGTYDVVSPDGFGGLTRLGEGKCSYNPETNQFDDTTSSATTARRFKEVTEVIFCVSNINSIARSHEMDPEEVLDIYTDYAVEDLLWAQNRNK